MVIALMYWDWFGSDEHMTEVIKIFASTCEEIEGIEYYGSHNVMNRKYHWVEIFDAENFEVLTRAISVMFSKVRAGVDSRFEFKKMMPYDHFEFLGGTLERNQLKEWLKSL